jgi:hypothetical protein
MTRTLLLATSLTELRTLAEVAKQLGIEKREFDVGFTSHFGSANICKTDLPSDWNVIEIGSFTRLNNFAEEYNRLVVFNNRLHINVWLMAEFKKRSKKVIYVNETLCLDFLPFTRKEGFQYFFRNWKKALRTIMFAITNKKLIWVLFRATQLFFQIESKQGNRRYSLDYDWRCVGYVFDSAAKTVNTGIPGLFANINRIKSRKNLSEPTSILFVSSPLNSIDKNIELTALLEVEKRLISDLLTIDKIEKLILRIHPLGDISLYETFFSSIQNLEIEHGGPNLEKAFDSSNFVVGWPSNFLLQSIFAGIPTMRLGNSNWNLRHDSFIDLIEEIDMPIFDVSKELHPEDLHLIVDSFPTLQEKCFSNLSTNVDKLSATRIVKLLFQ